MFQHKPPRSAPAASDCTTSTTEPNVHTNNRWAGLVLGAALAGTLGDLSIDPLHAVGAEPLRAGVSSSQQQGRGVPKIGDRISDITVLNREEKEIKLSQALGEHVVLVDFWASWCQPCRRENPSLVRAYTRFKDSDFVDKGGARLGRGFEIFSISVDTNKQQWLTGIKADRLTWGGHARDIGWATIGDVYGVQSIPANLLVDKDGTILARNLRGKELSEFLEKLRDTRAKK